METKLHSRKYMGRLAVMLMSAFVLVACNGERPEKLCIDSGDLGNRIKKLIHVESSNDGWVDAGIFAEQGKSLSIRTGGDIFLCMNDPQIQFYPPFSPASTNGNWQEYPNLVLEQGAKYTFEVTGGFYMWNAGAPQNCSAQTKYVDADCWSRLGKALYGRIPGNTTWGSAAEVSSPAWVGTDLQDDIETDVNNVFEMYRRDSEGIPKIMPTNAGYGIGSVVNPSKVWFRYRDEEYQLTDVTTFFSHPGWYADNTGSYTITAKKYSNCKGSKGKFLLAQIVREGGTPGVTTNQQIDLGKCSGSVNTPEANSDSCMDGLYSTAQAPASGKVFLKINDYEDTVSHAAGDGDYAPYSESTIAESTASMIAGQESDCTALGGTYNNNTHMCSGVVQYGVINGTGSNKGEYNVNLVAPRPSGFGSITTIINAVVDPVRVLLRGSKESVESTEALCQAKGTVKYMSCTGLDNTSCFGAGGVLIGQVCNKARSCSGGTVSQVTCSLNTPTQGLTERIYNNVTQNGNFTQGVRALIALAIVLFAFSYMAGLHTITHKEFLMLMFKIALVIVAIGPDSWNFFYKYLFSLFIDGSDNLIWIMSSSINSLISDTVGSDNQLMESVTERTGVAEGNAVFGFLNTTLSIMLSQETWIKFQALATNFPMGIFYMFIIIIGVLYFLFAMLKAILMYLTSIIMIAVLLCMGPIFICFILFGKTASIFKKWLAQIAVYAFQPVLLFVVLAVFNVFVLMALYTVLDFTACFTCIWYIDLPLSSWISSPVNFDRFCALPGYAPWGASAGQNVFAQISTTPLGLFSVLIFIIMTNLILKFVGWVDAMITQLVGEDAALLSTPAAPAATAMSQAKGVTTDTARNAMGLASVANKATGQTLGFAARRVLGAMDVITGSKDGHYSKKAEGLSFRPGDGLMLGARMVASKLPGSSLILGKASHSQMAGDKLAYGGRAMTSTEKAGYDKMMRDNAGLSAAHRQVVKDAHHKDAMDLAKMKAELLKEEKDPALRKIIQNIDNDIARERVSDLAKSSSNFKKDKQDEEIFYRKQAWSNLAGKGDGKGGYDDSKYSGSHGNTYNLEKLASKDSLEFKDVYSSEVRSSTQILQEKVETYKNKNKTNRN